ncbi:MAG TPA: PspC domain-containing protein [Candidatus Limnocylindrales bacterium]|jgi:phage shock protein PspC (stress-responsive transcriptional regulator)|nr:PspC domain-containing protein [Candidatus Limnocylindrales bacterium]
MNRRLYRCRHDRRLAGVAAGVAEFFGLDPTLVRVLWFLSIFFYGLGLLLYIGLAIIVPLEPVSADAEAADAAGEAAAEPEGHRHASHGDGPWTTLVGLALILFGTLALIDRFLPALEAEHFIVPVFAIGIGTFLVARALRREPMET